MASPPGTVRNLDLIPPSVTTFSSSRSDDVMAKTLRNSAGSSVPTGIDGLSPSTDFWTRRTVLSAPSCSYTSVPESVLSLAGYWFLLLEGTSEVLMNSIRVVLPLSLGPWNTVMPSPKEKVLSRIAPKEPILTLLILIWTPPSWRRACPWPFPRAPSAPRRSSTRNAPCASPRWCCPG